MARELSVLTKVYRDGLSVVEMVLRIRPIPASSNLPISCIPYAIAATGWMDTIDIAPAEPVLKLAVLVRKYPTKKTSTPTNVAVVALEKSEETANEKVMIAVKAKTQKTRRIEKLDLS